MLNKEYQSCMSKHLAETKKKNSQLYKEFKIVEKKYAYNANISLLHKSKFDKELEEKIKKTEDKDIIKKLQSTLKRFLKKKNQSLKKLGVNPQYKTITREDRKNFDKWIKLLNNQQCVNNLDPKFKVYIEKNN